MSIITISRQFGSGGRELGKRMADILEWDYYDREIITRIAEEHNLDNTYVKTVLSNHAWRNFEYSYRNRFNSPLGDQNTRFTLLKAQREIIEEIAQSDTNCIIVGRDADIILSEYTPLRIFVCADMKFRLDRCMKFEMKKESGRLTEKEITKNIKKIDKTRSDVREVLTGKPWGECTSFDLIVNTGGKDIKELARAVSEYALRWFEI